MSPSLEAAMLALYSLLMALLVVLASPWWLWQMARTGKYREGLPERLGRIPNRLVRIPGGPALAGAPCQPRSIWVHAVSVGEVLAASHLIEELSRLLPGSVVYVSTTTRTGQTLARRLFGAERVFYFPLDFAFAMRAWLRFLRPNLVVLVESEFWPRMLVECRRLRIPVAVVNARVSDRSWPRYQRLRVLWRPLLGSLALVLAQSETDAQRLRFLGATGSTAAGNLKYDIRIGAPAPAELGARLPSGVKVIVCGSTLAGEEELLLDALPRDQVITVLAPRHPERFNAVAQLLAKRGERFVRRSSWAARAEPGTPAAGAEKDDAALSPGTVVLLDTVGELASVYSLATLAVVGGGFLWPGGHNPLEAAQFGVPVLMGSQYTNFREVVDTLLEERGTVVCGAAELPTTLALLLSDLAELGALGERGKRVFEQQAGATGRALTLLLPMITGESAQAAEPVDAKLLCSKVSR